MLNRSKIKRDRVKDSHPPPPQMVPPPLPPSDPVASSSKTKLDDASRAERRARRTRRKARISDDPNDREFASGIEFSDLGNAADDQWERKYKRAMAEEEAAPEKRARKKEKDREKRKKEKEKAQARERDPKRKDRQKDRRPLSPPPNIGTGADFIGFDDSEAEADPPPPYEREWDRGKRRDDSRERDDRRRRERAKYEPKSTRYISHRIPWLDGVDFDDCNNTTQVLHREVQAFSKWMSPTPEEDEVRGLIVRQIQQAVTSHFHDAVVQPFGSYATKLYLPSGDIDLVIMSNSMAQSDRVPVLHALANTLKRARITDRVSIIAKARVPIVKFITSMGRFNVDISINQPNGLVGVDIVNGFLRDMHGAEAMRALVLITKLFLSQRSMNEVYSGGLGSYAIVCLVVSFLQMHPKVRRAEIDADQNLGVLVIEFFELYGAYFNYNESGISVRDGGTYFSKRQRGWLNDTRGIMLSVEDPADSNNDISAGSFGFSKVKATMDGAYKILKSTMYTKVNIINARRSGEALRLREQYEASDLSILSSIMNVPQETINHRRLVQEVFDSGELHKIMGVERGSTMETKAKSTHLDSSSDMDMDSSDHESRKKRTRSPSPSWRSPNSDVGSKRSRRARSPSQEVGTKRAQHDSPEDDDEGRYYISRRKKARQAPVTFTDDDSEDSDSAAERDYALSAGIGEEDDLTQRKVEKLSQSLKPRSQNGERNMNFWLAKSGGSGSVTPEG